MTVLRKRNQGERSMIPNGSPTILAGGKLGALVGFPMLVANKNDEYEEKMFEQFIRPPGTRMIVVRENKILLQKEYRLETDTEDWRLPGGKVVDSFTEYEPYIGKDMPLEIILEAGKRELREEAQLEARTISLFHKSVCGASVQWDLYYLLVDKFEHAVEIDNEEMEDILGHEWKTHDEVLELCKKGSISEDRTVAVLYRYITSNKTL